MAKVLQMAYLHALGTVDQRTLILIDTEPAMAGTELGLIQKAIT